MSVIQDQKQTIPDTKIREHSQLSVLGGYTSPMMIPLVFSKNLHIHGISVGSREQFDDMCAHIEKWKLKPVVDKVFAFDDLPDALRLMQAGGHFGKIVVKV